MMQRMARMAMIALLAAACGPPPKDPLAICEPGEQHCEGSAFQTCADDRHGWETQVDCAGQGQVCLAGRGCLTCFPDQRFCGGDGFDIYRCRADGSAADAIGRCDPDLAELCVAGGQCRDACELTAEEHSYEGCDYWAVDLDNAVVSDQGTAAAQQYAVVVSNPLELPATVRVEVNDAPPGMPPRLRTIDEVTLDRVPGGGDLAILALPPREVDGSSDPRLNDGSGTALSSAAYHVTSTAPIVAYQFNPLENVDVFSNDASLLLPTGGLGSQYLVMGWPQTLAFTDDAETNGGIDLRASLTIVGTEAETQVSVHLTTSILGSADIPPTAAGERLDLTIGPFDVINLETDGFNADFTGTSIVADKPVAVFSGSEAADVPSFETLAVRDCCADHLEEQLFPESAFGTRFVAVKTPLRSRVVEAGGWDVAVIDDEPEYWRVLATREDTIVRTNLPEPWDQFSLERGEFRTFPSERDFVLWANGPVSFAQFPVSQQATGIPSVISSGERPPGGDPSMILVPPTEQWREKYVFLVPNKYAFDFLLLALPVGIDILYDGFPYREALDCELEPIGTLPLLMGEEEFQAARCQLSFPLPEDPNDPVFQDDGRHVLESVDGKPFGLVVWGWDRFVSYGYPGGSNVELINNL